MRDGRVVKGCALWISRTGDPVECCRAYCAAGADAIAIWTSAATVENRPTLLEVVRRVADVATVPLTVGGGIRDTASAAAVLATGADKDFHQQLGFPASSRHGRDYPRMRRDAVVAAIDAAINPSMPSGYEVWIDGGEPLPERMWLNGRVVWKIPVWRSFSHQ